MLDFNLNEFDALISQNIGSTFSGLTTNQPNDILPQEASLGSTLSLSSESDETLVFRGTKNFDFLIGEASNDKLYGLAGDDTLNGQQGDDIINGGTDNDLLFGEKGNDILIDGDGGDLMTGGEGADEFWISNWDIPDKPSTISDFNIGTDTIKIGRLGATFDSLTFKNDPYSTTIYDDGKPLAILTGINKESLTPQSFVFGDATLANELQTNLEQSISIAFAPGVTQAIVTPNGFTWKGAAGLSNIEAQKSMHSDDVFSVASVTKAFTAATVLKIVESGQISLDDTLGERLPDIAQNIFGGEDITLRQLLNGSSGIPSFNSTKQFKVDLEADTFAGKTPEEIVAYVYGEPLFSGFQSSSTWVYTNTSDIIAALMVEQATGQSFAQLIEDNVIEPLGLDDTSYGISEKTLENLANSYLSKIGQPVTNITAFDVKNISAFGASSGLFSNAEDVARFQEALFGGELLSKDSLNELLGFVDTGLSDGQRYGLGILEKPDVASKPWGRAWSLVGNSFGYNTLSYYLPDDGGYINTVLTNGKNASGSVLQNPPAAIIDSSLEILNNDVYREQIEVKKQ
ncbi:MAG: serine hydrolase [Cyanobacteria bacterium P01_D01_bin.116]